MVTPIEKGKLFEEQATQILEEEGYEIVKWASKENWFCTYDFIVKKEGEEKYCEVRGRMTKKGIFTFSNRKLNRLRELATEKQVIFVFIRDTEYKIVSLDDLPAVKYVFSTALPERKKRTKKSVVRKLSKRRKRPKEIVGGGIRINVKLNRQVYLFFHNMNYEFATFNRDTLVNLMEFYEKNKDNFKPDVHRTFFDTPNDRNYTRVNIEISKEEYQHFRILKVAFCVRKNEEVIRQLIDFYLYAQGGLLLFPRYGAPSPHQIRVELGEKVYQQFRRAKKEMGVKTNRECIEKLLDFWERNHEEGKG